jgi:hypothetical protein
MIMKAKYKLGAAAATLGLAVGTLAGTSGAGADVLGGLAGLALHTTTTLTSTTPTFVDGVEQVTLHATVSIEGIKGALITPSGQVDFAGTYYASGTGEENYPLQPANLSSCVLGLPSILGLWQATCSATATFNLTYGNCALTEISAEYLGTSDLVAGPSNSPVIDIRSSC